MRRARSLGRWRGALVAITAALLLAQVWMVTPAQAAETHTVQPGDTLAALAAAHGVTVAALASANALDPAGELPVGIDLTIPAGASGASAVYIVQPGDTVASIAAAHGVAAADLIAANGVDDVTNLPIGTRLTVPGGGDAEASTAVLIPNVPAYKQARSLSCEYAGLYIATATLGTPIYEADSIWAAATSPNPHLGFRGNIDGEWGNTDDYGIYAEALVPILNQFGYNGVVSYGATADKLTAQLDLGRPTLVFLGYWGDTVFDETDNTGTYKLVPGYHLVVAYGYDAGGVYISNPGRGNFDYLSWDWFLNAWSVLDGMSLAVYPAAAA